MPQSGHCSAGLLPFVTATPLAYAWYLVAKTPQHLRTNPLGKLEAASMIYEVRTYTLRTGAVPEFEERYEKRLPARLKHSKLGAFWHTDFGPLNQVIHVYPYDDLDHRTKVRAALATDRERNALPGGQDLIVAQEAEIMIPAPFMRPLGSRDYGTGNIYEMRIYTYPAGALPQVLEAWAKAVPAREEIVGDDPAMAAPPHRLRAHDRAAPPASQLDEPGKARAERVACGVVGVIVEAAVLPQRIAPRRNLRLTRAPPA